MLSREIEAVESGFATDEMLVALVERPQLPSLDAFFALWRIAGKAE